VRLGDLIASFIRADVSVAEVEPYRAAGSDSYSLLDTAPPASWARLAAWNAFMSQVYADSLVFGGGLRYAERATAIFARHLYALASVWVKQTRMALASDAYRFEFRLPHPLPHWGSPFRTDAQLDGMRNALDTAMTRAASDLERFEGDPAYVDALRVRLAQIEAEADYVDRLWGHKRPAELRQTIGNELTVSLDHAYELGHLLAQPELLVPRR
jgi:hypothetical protein